MKKLIFLMVVFFTGVVFSQQQTLLGEEEMSYGGYGGPSVKIKNIKSDAGVLLGGKGAWVINHKFGIGLGGYGVVTKLKTDYEINDKRRVTEFGYGGVLLEYTCNSFELVHLKFGVLTGGGALSVNDGNFFDDSDYDENEAFFALEPEINVEVNITTFARISAGISYLYISNLDRFGFTENDFDGFSGNITVTFGQF